VKTHRDLEVWKNSIELVVDIYNLTRKYPKEELYGLISQIRRAASSIPANIAEGAGRFHNKEFIQFLYIAIGSVAELETHLVVSEKLKYISNEELEECETKIKIIRNQTLGLIKFLRSKIDSKVTENNDEGIYDV